MSFDPSDTLSFNDLKRHNNDRDCWIAVHSKIYDITNYLDSHPGGSSSLFLSKRLDRETAHPLKSYSDLLEATQRQPMMKSMPLAL